MIAALLPARLRGLSHADRLPTLYALVDQGLVSGFGFLSGLIVARVVDLSSFGRFALVMIFVSFAQSFQNALITSPMMTLIGSRVRGSAGYNASLVVVATIASVLAGLFVAGILVGFFALRGEILCVRFVVATAVFTTSQNIVFTVRRLLFASALGLRAVVMDGLRVLAFPAVLLVLHLLGVAINVTHMIEVLGGTALATSVPFILAFRPRRWGRIRARALVRRHGPLARWLMPVVVVTFLQEQLVWIVAGMMLGDLAIGGLRAAQYVVGLVLLLLAATENVIPVGASRAYAAEGRIGLRRYLLSTGGGIGLLLGIAILVVAIPADFWLNLIFGPDYVPFANCLRVIALAALLVHVRDMATHYFRATQRTGVVFQAFVFSLVVSLLVMVPLLKGAGLLGAALVVMIAHAASMSYMLVAALGTDARAAMRRSLANREPLRPANRP